MPSLIPLRACLGNGVGLRWSMKSEFPAAATPLLTHRAARFPAGRNEYLPRPLSCFPEMSWDDECVAVRAGQEAPPVAMAPAVPRHPAEHRAAPQPRRRLYKATCSSQALTHLLAGVSGGRNTGTPAAREEVGGRLVAKWKEGSCQQRLSAPVQCAL